MVDHSFVVEVRGLLSNVASSVDEREPTGAERAALIEWERKEGIVFPDDYRECVLRFGGRVFGAAKRPFVRCVGVRAFYATEFAGALLVMPRPAGFDRDRYRVTELFELAESEGHIQSADWSKDVMPIAGFGSDGLFCFDFRYNAENPPVVYVDWHDEWDGDRDRFWGIGYVASSFTDFVRGIEVPDSETDDWPTQRGATAEVPEGQVVWEEHRASLLGL